MKTLLISTVILFSGLAAMAQDAPNNKPLFSFEGKKRTHHIGAMGELYSGFSDVMAKPATWYGAKVGFVVNQSWTIGVAGNVLNYDHTLAELVNDGEYRLEAGYQGMYVEWMKTFNNRFMVNLSLTTGMGLAKYQYTKDFAENRPWYEEIIDQEVFSVFEPGAAVMVRAGGRWWLGLNCTARNTSPIKLQGTSEKFLQSANVGLSVRYGIF
jgi:hypothetical protein